MGLQQSKDELLYKEVCAGNIEGIKALKSQGAGLEWTDCSGRTPLLLACMSAELYNAAKTLVELGANVNNRGYQGETPLHYAAKRGLHQTVKLLLSRGANALMMNYDYQTPLDIARSKGYNAVVRAIEGHLCLFSGWLRELYGPGFLDFLAPQLLSRNVWVVILPCGSRNNRKPFKLELAIYTSTQDAQPRTIIPLWKANLVEHLNQSEPIAVISNVYRMSRVWKRRRCIRTSQEAGCSKIKFANAREKEELKKFCNACKGIPQVMHQSFPFNNYNAAATQATAPPSSENERPAMTGNASLQAHSIVESSTTPTNCKKSSNHDKSHTEGASTSNKSSHEAESCAIPKVGKPPAVPIASAPSAGAVIDNGPIQYPPIDLTHVESSSPSVEDSSVSTFGKREDDRAASSCTICLDAPLEGACIPCGHMAGCMSCLNEIMSKKWGCPVCRASIDQVVRIYSV